MLHQPLHQLLHTNPIHRAALDLKPDIPTTAMIHQSLGALFMSAGQPQDALSHMDHGIEAVEQGGSQAKQHHVVCVLLLCITVCVAGGYNDTYCKCTRIHIAGVQ